MTDARDTMNGAARRRVVLILQARMGSTRLPGKSLMPLAGKPLLYRILERVKRCRELDAIVVAIPDTAADEPLVKVAEAAGVSIFRGSEDDVLGRYTGAARAHGADIVGRLPADNVTPEPSEIDRIADYHRGLSTPGFSSNLAQVFGNGYPDGIGAEMVDASLLELAFEHNHRADQREHVHLNFFDYGKQAAVDPDWCAVSTIPCPAEFARPDIALDVNTLEQYNLLSALYADLYPVNPEFTIQDIVRWWDTRRPVKV